MRRLGRLPGLSANPAVGVGGTAILAETTELIGAEHLLAARVVDEHPTF